MPKDTGRDDYMGKNISDICVTSARSGKSAAAEINQRARIVSVSAYNNSVAETRMSLNRLFGASSIALPPLTMHSGSSSRPTPNFSPRELSQCISPQQLSPQHFSSSPNKPIYSRLPWRFLSGHDNERCFGPTSLE
ncbi:hypothetical protein HAV15_005617 [Penicillium sp. str. |nr:hypothetical protein HAV15_005617 [Penicillium sp. str. \